MVMDNRMQEMVSLSCTPVCGNEYINYDSYSPHSQLYPNPSSSSARMTNIHNQFSGEFVEKYPNTFFDDLFDGDHAACTGSMESDSDAVMFGLENNLLSFHKLDTAHVSSSDFGPKWCETALETGNWSGVVNDMIKIDNTPTLAELNDVKEDSQDSVWTLAENLKCENNQVSDESTPEVFASNIAVPSDANIETSPTSPVTSTAIIPTSRVQRQRSFTYQSPNLAKLLLTPGGESLCLKKESSEDTHAETTADGQHSLNSTWHTFKNLSENYEMKDNSTDVASICDTEDGIQSECGDTVSEIGSVDSQEMDLLPEQRSSRHTKPFWQYNVHGRKKMPEAEHLAPHFNDPHMLPQYIDPVFNPELEIIHGVRHDGKARRGDGNDVTPNLARLRRIGLQLDRLNKEIAHMTPISELSPEMRESVKRQKNKLASRVCRLKKKAQHEANKVKLFGLNQEHSALTLVIKHIRREMRERLLHGGGSGSKLGISTRLSDLITSHLGEMIAGNTTEYVNAALQKGALVS